MSSRTQVIPVTVIRISLQKTSIWLRESFLLQTIKTPWNKLILMISGFVSLITIDLSCEKLSDNNPLSDFIQQLLAHHSSWHLVTGGDRQKQHRNIHVRACTHTNTQNFSSSSPVSRCSAATLAKWAWGAPLTFSFFFSERQKNAQETCSLPHKHCLTAFN